MKRSEIWRINLDPTIGSEMRKTRPAVILSSDDIGILPLRIIAPITDWKPHYANVPWMVKVLPDNKTGLRKISAIDIFQLRSISVNRFIERIGKIDDATLQSATTAIAEVFEIPDR